MNGRQRRITNFVLYPVMPNSVISKIQINIILIQLKMENSFYLSSSNNYLSGRKPFSSSITQLSRLDSRAIGLLLLQNTLCRRECRKLNQQVFLCQLRQLTSKDTIQCSQIGPLTRNSEPNESIVSLKNITSDGLTRSVTQFKDCSRVMTNDKLLAMYKQKVNELDRLVMTLNGERRVLEDRQSELIDKLKGLKFQSVPTIDTTSQSDLTLPDLTKKELELKALECELKEENQQKMMALQCKENYLTYLEEAVCQKEQQLRGRESELARLQEKLNNDDMRYRVQPLSHLADPKVMFDYFALMKDRIYDAVQQYQQGSEEALQLLQNHPLYELLNQYDKYNQGKPTTLKLQIFRTLQASCLQIRHKLEVAETYFKQQYDQILQLRQTLQLKNMKFAQLSSYQKYLNKYKDLLDLKQKQLTQTRQRFFQQVQVVMNDDKTYSYSDASFSLKNFQQNQPKNHSKQRIFQKRDNNSSLLMKEYTTRKTGAELDEEKKYISVKINEMKEEYTKRVEALHKYEEPLIEKVHMLTTQNEVLKKTIANFKKQKQVSIHENTVEEDPQQDLNNVLEIAKKKQLLIKYLGAWFQFDFRKNIKTPAIAKKFAFNKWRIQQYDPTIFTKIVDLTSQVYEPYVQKLWQSTCQKDRKDKLYPYKSLSLKRKQFLEEFFDFQRKQFFKNRLRTMIRSIVRNKIRKERVVMVVAFQRFIRNCALLKPKDSKTVLKAIVNSNIQSSGTLAGGRDKKSSITNSRTTLQYESNKTSQVKETRDKSAIKAKQVHQKQQQYRAALENQRIELQSRLRRNLACSKIFGFCSLKDNQITTKKACAFYLWNKLAIDAKTSQSIRKAEGKIEQFQFKMNLVNTKFKISQSNMSSKLQLIQQLLSVVVPK